LPNPARARRDHGLGLGHRDFDWQRCPRVGAKVVATQQDACGIKPHLARNAMHKAHEISRGHAGIAAVLVDLVAGGFKQHKRQVMAPGMAQRSLDHQWMCRAD
jgi:hypothetical protein